MKKLLSLIALAGIFAACQPEELKTSFTVDPAEVTINVRVVDIRTPKVNLTSGFTISTSVAGAKISSNAVVIKGTKDKPVIDKQDVTLTVSGYKADYMNEEQEAQHQTVTIEKLRAGGKATYGVTFIVGCPESEYEFSYKETAAGDAKEETEYFTPSDSHAETHTHDGGLWVRNNTEFILTGVVTYNECNGAVAKAKDGVNEYYKEIVDDYVKALTYGYDEAKGEFISTPKELNIKVSAYCYYTAYQTYTKVSGKEYTVYVKHTDEKGEKEFAVGVITVNSREYTSAQYEEKADPNGHGHYVYGHGHAHGHGTDNAGGGIVIPE